MTWVRVFITANFALGATSAAFAEPIRTFDDLVAFVKNEGVSSIEDLMPKLDSELRSNYSLVFKSRSPIGANFTQPRIILWSKDAKFILAFSGDPELQGGRKLEVVHFNNQHKKFEFHQIEFSSFAGHPPVIERNSSTCMACHSSSFHGLPGEVSSHPIWDTYPDWPGVYGTSHKTRILKGQFVGSSEVSDSKKVEEEWRKFRRSTANEQSRYAYLEGIHGKNLDQLADINSSAGSRLLERENEALAHVLSKNAKFNQYSQAIRASFSMRESNFINALPLEDRAQFLNEKSAISDEITRSFSYYFSDKAARLNKTSELAGRREVRFIDETNYFGVPMRKKNYIVNFEYRKDYPELTRFKFVLKKMGEESSVPILTRESVPFAVGQGSGSLRDFLRLLPGESEKPELVGESENCKRKFASILKGLFKRK